VHPVPISYGSLAPLRLRCLDPRRVYALTFRGPFDLEPFGPSCLRSTMTSADFSQFAVATVCTACETSRDKPSIFPRLPARSTCMGYGCPLDFTTFSQLIRHTSLGIRFLFVRLRFRYCFFSPTPHGVKLASRYGVRRQLRPLWTSTTD